jgi:hypothetical protein
MATRFNVDPGEGPVVDVPWRYYRRYLVAAAAGSAATALALLRGGLEARRALIFGVATILTLALLGAVFNDVVPRAGKWLLFALLVIAAAGSTAFVVVALPAGIAAPACALAWFAGGFLYFVSAARG